MTRCSSAGRSGGGLLFPLESWATTENVRGSLPKAPSSNDNSISAEDVDAIAMDQQQRPNRALAPMIMSGGLHPAGFALRHGPVDVLGYRQISHLLSQVIDITALHGGERNHPWPVRRQRRDIEA